MNCKQIIQEIERAFDEGATVDAAITEHMRDCTSCADYHRALFAIDQALRHAPPTQPDPVLVARIQATIALQPARSIRPWAFPVSAAASILGLAGLGRLLDGVALRGVPPVEQWFSLDASWAEWSLLKNELLGIPTSVAGDLNTLVQATGDFWNSISAWQSGLTGSLSPWIWVLLIGGIVGACILDGAEWKARRMNRSGQ